MTVSFILLSILQLISGFALLSRSRKVFSWQEAVPLSWLLGLFISSFSVYIAGILKIPLVFSALAGIQAALAFALLFPLSHAKSYFKTLGTAGNAAVKLYDLVFYCILLYFVFISGWRAWYLPVTPYDAVNGIDLFAKFAFKEQTLVSSIFNREIIENLGTQAFYAPFTSFLQIVYRSCGFEWGQVWLTIVFASFSLFLYHYLKRITHGIFAALAVIGITVTPELFAYTFLLQTDYSNAVYFSIGILFFYEYYRLGKKEDFFLTVVFLFVACWSRSETIFFLPLGSLLLLYQQFDRKKVIKSLIIPALFTVIPVMAFVLWNIIFYRLYLPYAPDTASELKIPDYSFDNLQSIVADINNQVVFATDYWGYAFYFFIIALIAGFLVSKDRTHLVYVYWIAVMYLVFLLLKIHLVHIEVSMTVRRGYFKFIMLYYVFIACSPVFTLLGDKLNTWEGNNKSVK